MTATTMRLVDAETRTYELVDTPTRAVMGRVRLTQPSGAAWEYAVADGEWCGPTKARSMVADAVRTVRELYEGAQA